MNLSWTRRALLAATVAASAMLGACAVVEPVLPPASAAAPGAGYLAGEFVHSRTRGFALVIKSVEPQGPSYTMSMGEWGSMPGSAKDRATAIQVAPGKYTISQWITYATLTHEVATRRTFANSIVERPFEVHAGEVVHVGYWEVSERPTYGGVNMHIEPREASEAEMHQLFRQTYPKLGDLSFRCLLCSDTVEAARKLQ